MSNSITKKELTKLQTNGLPLLRHISLKDILLVHNYRSGADADLAELEDSIETKGLLQPILVKPKGNKYQLVCGERRYLCSVNIAKRRRERNTIAAVVREMTDDEAFELQLIENLQRKDVHPLDEAAAYQKLESRNYSIQTIANTVDKSITYVAQRLKLNSLIPELRDAYLKGLLHLGHCLELCKHSDEVQKEFWSDDLDNGKDECELTVADLRRTLMYDSKNLNDAAFDTRDPYLVEKVGACTTCVKNTSSQQLLFPDTESRCLDKACFALKTNINFATKIDEAKRDANIVFLDNSYSTDKKLCAELKKEGYPVFDRHNTHILEKPEFDADDYDEEEIEEAKADYEIQLQEYEEAIKTANVAFVINGDEKGKMVYYTKLRSTSSGTMQPVDGQSAEELNDKQLLEELKVKLNKNNNALKHETRSAIHDALFNADYLVPQKSNSTEWTILRYFLYKTLDFNGQEKFHELIGMKDGAPDDYEKLFTWLMELSNKHFMALLRMVVVQEITDCVSGSANAYMTDKFAEELGIDTYQITNKLQTEAANKNAKLIKQIADLEAKYETPKVAGNAKKLTKNANKLALGEK